ncbi:MAG: vWA domain-containing protein, partial [Bacteroidota bacterium]
MNFRCTQVYLLLIFSIGIGPLAAQTPFIKKGIHARAILKTQSVVYAEPDNGSAKVGSLSEFSIIYLFEFLNKGPKKNKYYYIGTDPQKPMGWITQDNILEWNNRVCLNFSPLIGREPALIYPKKEDLKSVFEAQDSRKGSAIAEEPGNVAEYKFNMLFPILDNGLVKTGAGNFKVFEIGYLGKEMSPTSKMPIPVLNPNEKAILELLFVVDATSSMQEYITGIKGVVREIANKVNGMRESGVYYGLLAYRDRTRFGPLEGWVTNRYLPLEKNYIKVLSSIDQMKAAKADSEDLAEAVFDGLYQGITETQWSKTTSSLRVIVLIGDASAHDETSDKNPLALALKEIRDEASKNRVRVIALQLNRGINKEDAEKFEEQSLYLAQGQSISDRGYYDAIQITDEGEIDPNYIKILTKAIENEISTMEYLLP